MEQRSQMLRQMRLTKTEREREVGGSLVWGRGAGGRSGFGDPIGLGNWNDSPHLTSPESVPISRRPSAHVGPARPPFSCGTKADFPQAQLVKDRHSALRLESLYSDEEDESGTGADKIQMTWTRDKYMAAESWDPSHAPDNFRELVHIKP